jgi:hypothetical protein
MAENKRATGITKKEGVQQALAELGKDAKPADIQKYVKEKLGLDISTSLAKEYKGDLTKAKPAAKKPSAPKPATTKPGAKKPATSKPPAPKPPVRPGPAASGIPLQDILTIKELVGRLGAKPLHTLIDAFAK